MVTHVPPPSPSLSSASLSTITDTANRRPSSRAPSQALSSTSARHAPSSYRPPLHVLPPSSFPPSPPLSQSHASSPPSSYIAPRLPESRAQTYNAPSISSASRIGSRATDAARRSRHRDNAESQAESRYHSRRVASHVPSTVPSSIEESRNEQQNAFPWFGQSGDVEISLNARSGRVERKYRLHNLILKQNSGWWASMLNDVTPAASTNSVTADRHHAPLHPDHRGTRVKSAFSTRSARRGSERSTTSKIHVESPMPLRHFELDWRNVSSHDGFPIFVTKIIDEPASRSPVHSRAPKTHPPTSNTSFFRSITRRRSSSRQSRQSFDSSTSHPSRSSTTVVPADTDEDDRDILTAYASLFATMYNHAPTLDAGSLPDAYVQAKTLLRLAALYSSLAIVRPRVEHHLLHFNRALYRNIARYPPSYLKLGYLLESQQIFGEALIHVVGQWPAHERLLTDVDERVKDLIEDKHDELSEIRNKVDGRLFRIGLSTSRGDRVSPGTSFLDWMAICLFRQWLVDETSEVVKRGILKSTATSERHDGRAAASDSRAKLLPVVVGRPYRLMSQGGDAYLTHSEVKPFLKRQAPREMYSREELKRLERRIDEIKAQARDQVRGICRSFLEGDGEYDYLTCTRVEDRDYRWVWQT